MGTSIMEIAFQLTGENKLMIKQEGYGDKVSVYSKDGKILTITISRTEVYSKSGFIRAGELSLPKTKENLLTREEMVALVTQTILTEIYHKTDIRDRSIRKEYPLTSHQQYLVDKKVIA